MKEMTISIFEQVGGNAAVSSEDGEAVFQSITRVLESGGSLVLDFANIELITSTFLNACIGQLYNQYDSPFLRKHIKVQNMAEEDMELLKKVVERAKEYFKDKVRVENSIKEVLG